MIGYYVHHQGRGHLHRATALQAAWHGDLVVTGLSTLPRPADWRGPWVQLPADDGAEHPVDVTAGEQLHWAPLGDPGVRARAAALSAWLEQARPSAVVVDVSVEVVSLVRLHGVPVISMVLPGRRADPVHVAGFRTSSALVAVLPVEVPTGVDFTPGLPLDVRDRIVRLGAVSRFAPVSSRTNPDGRRAVLLQGRGGGAMWDGSAAELESGTPGWSWTVLGGSAPWVARPSATIAAADVVVVNAGQGSLADVAALRRPAVVVPADRPYDEQRVMATALATGPWPVVVADSAAQALQPHVLEQASSLDGNAWCSWCDGRAAERLRRVVESVTSLAGGLQEPA